GPAGSARRAGRGDAHDPARGGARVLDHHRARGDLALPLRDDAPERPPGRGHGRCADRPAGRPGGGGPGVRAGPVRALRGAAARGRGRGGDPRGISFHVVGGVFDTVFKEGAYLLRPGTETRGGAQSLDLAAAQGGFVELVFDEPGTYTAVNHAFADMERGARALIRVTA